MDRHTKQCMHVIMKSNSLWEHLIHYLWRCSKWPWNQQESAFHQTPGNPSGNEYICTNREKDFQLVKHNTVQQKYYNIDDDMQYLCKVTLHFQICKISTRSRGSGQPHPPSILSEYVVYLLANSKHHYSNSWIHFPIDCINDHWIKGSLPNQRSIPVCHWVHISTSEENKEFMDSSEILQHLRFIAIAIFSCFFSSVINNPHCACITVVFTPRWTD